MHCYTAGRLVLRPIQMSPEKCTRRPWYSVSQRSCNAGGRVNASEIKTSYPDAIACVDDGLARCRGRACSCSLLRVPEDQHVAIALCPAKVRMSQAFAATTKRARVLESHLQATNGIFNRLSFLGRGAALAHRDDLATKPLHRSIKGAHGPSRWLVEHIGKYTPGQDRCCAFLLHHALHFGGGAEDLAEHRVVEVVDGEHVPPQPRRRHRAKTSLGGHDDDALGTDT
eukprot:6186015-Pleurochrysis_carterae.AAC.2